MAGRRQRRLMNQINVVPYIDVMLVLLVIFMVTAPLLNPGVVELPTIGESSRPPTRPLEVTIRANGNLSYVDRQVSSASRAVSSQELVDVIQTKQEQNPDQPVVISADKAVRYEKVMEVMDLLQKLQVQRVGLMAVPKG
ncbi:MAG: protein TolR [Betaproteobacteria bacterium SG8_40]|nr:MAG: protein TolR [Betaproteobacteria bacterium SG8_40]